MSGGNIFKGKMANAVSRSDGIGLAVALCPSSDACSIEAGAVFDLSSGRATYRWKI